MKRKLIMCVFALLSFGVMAADVPAYDEGAAKYNSADCVAQETQNCFSEICITSDDIDCESKCKDRAVDKCKQKADD